MKIEKSKLVSAVIFIFLAGIFGGYFIAAQSPKGSEQKNFQKKSIDQQREEWIEEANIIRGKLATQGKYDCCLEKPCWYCIQKTPSHGEGATCECRQNILDGEHPCGECIGEILEGHGEPDLAPFYAKAIAHKVGNQHLDHLENIIADLYKL